MSAMLLLAHLRGTGVSISAQRGRLIVEAPPGVVSAELHAELRERKAELIAALEAECVPPDESIVLGVRREIADLLAIAYQRYAAMQRAGADRLNDSGKERLANSDTASVHGVVS